MEDVNKDALENQRRRVNDEICHWKQQSIEKIEETAQEALGKLSEIFSGKDNRHLQQLFGYHEDLANQMQQAEAQDGFHERHLKCWHQLLDDLQKKCDQLRKHLVRIEYGATPFIPQIIVRGSPPKLCVTQWRPCRKRCPAVSDIRCSLQEFEV